MSAAIEIGNYFIGHALAVFDLMGADPTIDAARYVLNWIRRQATIEFSFCATRTNR